MLLSITNTVAPATDMGFLLHQYPARLLDDPQFERVFFAYTPPATVVVTTPNREYNAKFPSLPAGQLRHLDHRFEWTRAVFQTWANAVTTRFGCRIGFLSVGPEDAPCGAPTQLG
jgi:hypothetical protein